MPTRYYKEDSQTSNDGNDHHVEDYHENNEILVAIQDMTDCLNSKKNENQYKQLCSSISLESSISSPSERDYRHIEEYNEESTDDETETAEINFESQDPDFRRDRSTAHESFRTKMKDKLILKKPIPSEIFTDIDTTHLIQKLIDFARKPGSDIQTLVEE